MDRWIDRLIEDIWLGIAPIYLSTYIFTYPSIYLSIRRLGRIKLEYLRRALRVRPTGGGESAGVEEGVERRES